MPDTSLPYYYTFERPEILALVPDSACAILELGCAAGRLGQSIKNRQACHLTGVEMHPQAAAEARKCFDVVVEADLESGAIHFPAQSFDTVICADVLEHLKNPWQVLASIHTWLQPGGTLICSIPNIANLGILQALTEGQWTYAEAGILDRTHLRFFTRSEFQTALTQVGFQTPSIFAIKDHPFLTTTFPSQADTIAINAGRLSITGVSKTAFEELTAVQFLFAAKKSAAGVIAPSPLEKASGSSPALASLVVLAHNERDYTALCLQSILAHTDCPYEVIVVDNASTDATPETLAQLAPAFASAQWCKKFHCVRSDRNLGFAGGNNLGMTYSSGHYVVLMNNDLIVTPGWLTRLAAGAMQSDKIGIAGPMSNYTSGPQLVKSPGYDTSTCAGLNEFALAYARSYAGQTQAFWRVVGFCLLIKQTVLQKIGGLDPRFGLGNFEDDDYCLRTRLAGFEARIVLDCFVHHFGSRTFAGAKIDYSQSLRTNWEIFKTKWGLPQQLAYGSPFNFESLMKSGFSSRYFCPLTPSPEPALAQGA